MVKRWFTLTSDVISIRATAFSISSSPELRVGGVDRSRRFRYCHHTRQGVLSAPFGLLNAVTEERNGRYPARDAPDNHRSKIKHYLS
ncbi:MAG: hypothetical protein LBS40_05150 [Burkholderiales bacterium]|jgi:hypothetical protein|nr:hypothetical protein [Burkholderiales bacterium]